MAETKETMNAKVAAKGLEIAALKKEKGAKDPGIKPLVDQLLALKAQYKEVTGEDFPKPAAAPKKKKAAPVPARFACQRQPAAPLGALLPFPPSSAAELPTGGRSRSSDRRRANPQDAGKPKDGPSKVGSSPRSAHCNDQLSLVAFCA